MGNLKIEKAQLISTKKFPIKIHKPKIKSKKGILVISGVLDLTPPSTKEKAQEFKEHLGLNNTSKEITEDDYLQITGIGEFGSEVTISKVHCRRISYSNMHAEFITYDGLINKSRHPVSEEIDNLNTIVFEGLNIAFDGVTQYDFKRTILGEEQSRPLKSKWDYTEERLNFLYNNNAFDFQLTFLDFDNKQVGLRFEQPSGFPLKTYQEIKQQLKAFLSFPNGNNLNVKEEYYEEGGVSFNKVYSSKKVKNTARSEFIPIHSIHFRGKNVFSNYLRSFSNFLFLDEHLNLTAFVFLFNQSRKEAIDTSIFIMLIALEKLGSAFIESNFFSKRISTIIDPNEFSDRIKNTKKQFKKDFGDVKDFQNLNSKLGNLNQKNQTDKKIEALLEFAEVEMTNNVEHLFTALRNKAIHEGDIHTDGNNGFENYTSLTNLCNTLFCNIIQYKGLRFIEYKEGKNFVEQKTEYRIDYKKFR